MPDKAWKKRERDVAGYFNGLRTPLSGGNGKITRADVIHDNLFIESIEVLLISIKAKSELLNSHLISLESIKL